MINKKYRYSDVNIDVTDADKKNLSELFGQFKMQSDKSIGTGLVTKITDSEVWVDIGVKSEGVLPIEEFNLKGFGQKPMVGDTIEVWVQNTDSNVVKKGKQEQVSISFARAAQIRSWWALEQSYKNKKLVDGIILSKVPGGYLISILPYGARGFLPLSQSDPHMGRNNEILQKYKNEIHQYLIVRMERNLNIILSRREAIFMDAANADQQNGEGTSASSNATNTEGGEERKRSTRTY
jgi:small subunit ribosomal protein S1